MNKLSKGLAVVLATLMGTTVYADAIQVTEKLKVLYPNTEFEQVSNTAMPGIYEVVMGKNIAYVQEEGRYFIFGALYDMAAQKDLTSERKAELDKVVFTDLPLKNAIEIKKGNGGKGKRTFALFSDPDCPYCQRLEETLAGMDDYTVYLFLYPLASLHPTAIKTAKDIWCSKDPKKAWLDYMLFNKSPQSKACTTPIAQNIDLGNKLGMNGTPSMIHIDGRKTAGAMPRAELEQWLGERGN